MLVKLSRMNQASATITDTEFAALSQSEKKNIISVSIQYCPCGKRAEKMLGSRPSCLDCERTIASLQLRSVLVKF